MKSVDHDVEIKFDRGYGKMTLLSAVGIKGYSMRTIACEIGSKHPFIKAADAVAFKESLIRDSETDLQDDDDNPMVATYKELEPFILDGTELGGAQVTSAKKEVEIGPKIGQDNDVDSNRRAKAAVHAYGIRDVFDKKNAVKDLRVFSTGGRLDNETAHVWVVMEKHKLNIHKNVLFSNTKASAKRLFVETQLLYFCQPLTIADKVAEWFLLRRFRFRFTGTMGATLA